MSADTVQTKGSETILLVEDETEVRTLIERFLRMEGYTVLAASGPTEALSLCETYGERIHLLLTDVVLPEMSGRDLAARVCAARPGTKVLFVSGYGEDAVAHHGIQDANTAFLQKPFSSYALTRRVRELLDAPLPSSGG